MPTPYAEYVRDRDPIELLHESRGDYQHVIATLSSTGAWNTPWSPGKWTARQILVHVAQWEMILGERLRCGLQVPGYVVQPIEQDLLIGEASVVTPDEAAACLSGVRGMNLALARSLSRAERQRQFAHPERGTIDVEDILITLAGHGVHHLRQLQAIVNRT